MMRAAVIFPGQGAQYVGMAKELTDKYAFARTRFAEASDAAGIDLLKLCAEGPLDRLTLTANAQPAVLAASYIAFEALQQETGLEPTMLAGHSLGEYTALACAGGLSFYDAVRIVRYRGQLMQQAVAPGIGAMMSIIGPSAERVECACAEATMPGSVVVISNYNSPEQTVISGHSDAVERCGELLQEEGAKTVKLNVSAPFHSPLMEEASESLREELLKLDYKPLRYQVISNVTALPHHNESGIAELLTRQLTAPVMWAQTAAYIAQHKMAICIDTGPSSIALNLMRSTSPTMKLFAYDKTVEQDRVHRLFRHMRPAAPSTLAFVSRCLAIAVCTPNTNWNASEYEEGAAKPYKDIHQLQLKLDEEGRAPTDEEMARALEMLVSVFETKRTPPAEQRRRYEQLMKETGTESLFYDKGLIDDVASERQYPVSR
ncbi:[acyl-carrier-protein] S-malonyltransferase [Paenibacillus cellulosilyticus]|uniref:[acyl-carrier-protein] S-malonyltransferase n=1 Tax=Paenibacillus cellulosilyticus TaxID=375489 RepID=A0A2V2YVH9_9BACL|nr:ACP S-malonyltransferase [Paenibacillus cellulosilyticus]PWW04859.1 [acyl-carrier-protein] S-malonyltransferase [Paenibacillus cellulosilyticus]QKS45970.1 ACP S-malonyltransferase [Paenibacillus cellulosilyticus]